MCFRSTGADSTSAVRDAWSRSAAWWLSSPYVSSTLPALPRVCARAADVEIRLQRRWVEARRSLRPRFLLQWAWLTDPRSLSLEACLSRRLDLEALCQTSSFHLLDSLHHKGCPTHFSAVYLPECQEFPP